MNGNLDLGLGYLYLYLDLDLGSKMVGKDLDRLTRIRIQSLLNQSLNQNPSSSLSCLRRRRRGENWLMRKGILRYRDRKV